MKRNLILTIFLLYFNAYALADTSIKAEVDKTRLTTDDSLTYKITIESNDKKISRLKIPELNGFDIIAQTQVSSIAFQGNKPKTSVVYSFILVPVETGKLSIEPASISVGRQIYSTSFFEIEVTQGEAKPQIPSSPEGIPSQATSDMPQFTL
ncbi:MAG: BatD family protein [Candidatus Omnitrophica bacterium]|nr:BatD family protein [Candidatus Omnitrophota bacterium]